MSNKTTPRIKPNELIPDLSLKTLDGRIWPEENIETPSFYLLSVYRGLQCSHCKKALQELNNAMPDLHARNVNVIAASADNRARAQQAVDEWGLNNLRMAYDLDIDLARNLGLYISESVRPGEMPVFTEPGLFLIRPNQTLFAAWISSYPFARPHIDEIWNCIDYIEQHKRPPRGTA